MSANLPGKEKRETVFTRLNLVRRKKNNKEKNKVNNEEEDATSDL